MTSPRVISRLPALVTATALVLAGPASTADAATAPAASPAVHSTAHSAAHSAAHPAGHRAAAPRLDTWDRAAVASAYAASWVRQQQVPSGWTGQVQGCQAGRPSAAAQRATLASVNLARSLAHLDPVRWSARLSASAQQAALVMAAAGTLSHTPLRSWACWTPAAADAAAHANLALATPTLGAGQVASIYLADAGVGNEVAGHRRWLLDPDATAFGNGMTSITDAMYVVGPTSTRRANPAWVSWPSPGFFPSQLEPAGRWSLSSGSTGADFTHARVTVTHVVAGTAAPVRVTAYPPAVGYAQPTLVFDVHDVQHTGTYRVRVTGIRHAASTTRSWTVRLFTPAG